MSDQWRELLDRALEGEELSPAEARQLADAISGATGREDALAHWCFEALLERRLAPRDRESLALSRERLLAKAALRERAAALRSPAVRTRRNIAALSAAAALILIIALSLILGHPRAGYPEPQARGEYTIAGPPSPSVLRGRRLTAGAAGAELRLGGYCRLSLDPNTSVVVRGEARREAVELERGRVVSEVEPARGEFTLLTPLGPIEVKGTKFLTSVEYPDSLKGETDMGKLRKSAVVTVMVVTGVVACHFGDAVILRPGMSQVFAGDEGERATLPPELKGFKGILVGTITSEVGREFNLKIEKIVTAWPQSRAEHPERAVGKTVEIVVGENRLLEQHLHTLKGLRKGDKVIVEAFDLQGFRLTVMELFRKAEGEGERREGEGEIRERRPHHEGEGEVREKPHARESQHGGPAPVDWSTAGFKSIVFGTILSKGEEEFTLKVDKVLAGPKAGEAESADALKGQEVKITIRREGIVRPRHAQALAELKVGQRAEVGIRHVEGKTYAVVSLIRRAEGTAPAGEGEVREKRPHGEGEIREKRPTGEGHGEGEVREKKPERRDGEGEGEMREKKTEPRAEGGMREMTGWVKATPDRDCPGILKVVERVETEEGVREKATIYRIAREGLGEKLVGELSGRRVRVAGVVTPGEGGIEPGIVIKHFRALDGPAGEGERRDKPTRRDGEGEVREKRTREGEHEGEVREKPIRRDGEGELRERPFPRDDEGEVREKRAREGEGSEERPATPKMEGAGLAPQEAIEGFRGMLEGVVAGKTSDALVIRVERVNRVWQSNTSKNPEALAGKIVTLRLQASPPEAIAKALAEVKAGDRVLAGAIHRDGKVLALAEVLRKLQAE